jgi:hypothetical protein
MTSRRAAAAGLVLVLLSGAPLGARAATAASEEEAAPADLPPQTTPLIPPEEEDPRVERRRIQRAVGLALAGVGAGAVGMGVAFSMEVRDLTRQVDRLHMQNGGVWNARWDRYEREARNAARAVNMLFVLGGAAMVGGAVLMFLGWPSETAAVSAAPHPGGGFSLVATCAF